MVYANRCCVLDDNDSTMVSKKLLWGGDIKQCNERSKGSSGETENLKCMNPANGNTTQAGEVRIRIRIY